jgi:hypothetical protein
MIAVFAGNQHEFEWFRDHEYDGNERLVYVRSYKDIAGRQFTGILYAGTYYEHYPVWELIDACKLRVKGENPYAVNRRSEW